MPRYSVTGCHLNMVETVEAAVLSVVEQVDDRFELVVVDGGSTDGSLEILRDLDEEHDRFRLVVSEPEPGRRMGSDRQLAVEEARGEYVLPFWAGDDEVRPVLDDLVRLYHQLEDQLDFAFHLLGGGMEMAPRSLLMEVPFRNLQSGEDKDLWRRMLARDALLWVEFGPGKRSLGYERPWLREIWMRDVKTMIADFQCGLPLAGALIGSIEENLLGKRGGGPQARSPPLRLLKVLFDLVVYPFAYLAARTRPRFETPAVTRDHRALEEARYTMQVPIHEIEDRHGIEVDRSELSPTGREVLCVDEG